ncbi:MAG: arylmalonate decarboxylase, partial [Synergistaceae bacterium]|nr:arylmalonate decarboxylase [Synergistaceae bacterium]
ALDRPEADTILLSCGAPRFMEMVEEIEKKTGKTVIASNQAMLWNTLRMAGINDKIEGLGRLFREH